jgi:hypothetical protein
MAMQRMIKHANKTMGLQGELPTSTATPPIFTFVFVVVLGQPGLIFVFVSSDKINRSKLMTNVDFCSNMFVSGLAKMSAPEPSFVPQQDEAKALVYFVSIAAGSSCSPNCKSTYALFSYILFFCIANFKHLYACRLCAWLILNTLLTQGDCISLCLKNQA